MGLDKKQKCLIEELFIEKYYSLSAYAYSVLQDRLLAEEAVQDTFRIACAKPDKLLSSPNPGGWLMEALKNNMQTIIRNRAKLSKIVISSIDCEKNIDIEVMDEPDVDFLYSNLTDNDDYKLLKKIALSWSRGIVTPVSKVIKQLAF